MKHDEQDVEGAQLEPWHLAQDDSKPDVSKTVPKDGKKPDGKATPPVEPALEKKLKVKQGGPMPTDEPPQKAGVKL